MIKYIFIGIFSHDISFCQASNSENGGTYMVTIKEVTTKKDQKIFAQFHEALYRDVPQAIPDLISDEINNFNPAKNPAYAFCRSKQFLAYKEGKVVGRIAGIISDAANEKWGTKRLRFSRVDFIDDPEVSKALFEAVENWGREQGLTEVHGPMGFHDQDQEGMLIDGFEEMGMFITIHNAPYYKEHMEKLGYTKSTDWVEYQISVPDQVPEKLTRISELMLRRYRLKLVTPSSHKDIPQYLGKILKLVNDSYKDLYGQVALSDEMLNGLYEQFKLMINPEYVKIILNDAEDLVGFGLAVPSISDAVKKSRGRLFPFGWYRILTAPKKRNEVIDLYLIGVAPEYMNKGLPAALIASMVETAIKNGVKFAETGPELETNTSVQALWKYFETRQHRRRRCWVKEI